jgi:hypothetical protein
MTILMLLVVSFNATARVGDTSTVGTYYVEFEVTYSDGAVETFLTRLTSGHYTRVKLISLKGAETMVDNEIYNDYVTNLPNSMSYDTGTDRYDINGHSFFPRFKNSNWYFSAISKYGYSALSKHAVNN